MTDIVKEFIEATIVEIDHENWHDVFETWYEHFADSKSNDYANLEELFQIFEAADMHVYKESEEARKEIIADKMYEYIDGVLTDDPDVQSISLPDAARHLTSNLHVSLVERNNIFKDIGNKMVLQHPVHLEPFKIVRN